MSEPSPPATLLAVLLALRSPGVTLDKAQQARLFEVGEQLELDPDDWDSIQADLMAIITSNPPLEVNFKKYQAILARFLASEGGASSDWLPTSEEVRRVLQLPEPVEKRCSPPGKPNQSPSNAIINDIVVPILKSDNPTQNTQSLFERLLTRLRESSDSDDFPPMLPPGI